MSSRSKQSHTVRVSRAAGAISGIQKYLASFPSLVLAAATYTPVQLEALLQAYATAVTALQLLHAQVHTAVTSLKSQGAQVDAVLSALESFVVNMFGAHSEQVTEFGFTPPKVTVLTAAPATQTVSNGAPVKA
jgi:DNA-binding FrmR family transcriptional regulator